MLQDDHEQSVPLVLWGIYLGGFAKPNLDDEALEGFVDQARSWHEQIIDPIRRIRRRLKSPISDIETKAQEAVRQDIKAVELRAEQGLMQGFVADAFEIELKKQWDRDEALGCVTKLAKIWHPKVPREALRRLICLLGTDNQDLPIG